MTLVIKNKLNDEQAKYLTDAFKVYSASMMECGVDDEDWKEGREVKGCLDLIESEKPVGKEDLSRISRRFNKYRYDWRHFRADIKEMGAAEALGVEEFMAMTDDRHNELKISVAKAFYLMAREIKRQGK